MHSFGFCLFICLSGLWNKFSNRLLFQHGIFQTLLMTPFLYVDIYIYIYIHIYIYNICACVSVLVSECMCVRIDISVYIPSRKLYPTGQNKISFVLGLYGHRFSNVLRLTAHQCGIDSEDTCMCRNLSVRKIHRGSYSFDFKDITAEIRVSEHAQNSVHLRHDSERIL